MSFFKKDSKDELPPLLWDSLGLSNQIKFKIELTDGLTKETKEELKRYKAQLHDEMLYAMRVHKSDLVKASTRDLKEAQAANLDDMEERMTQNLLNKIEQMLNNNGNAAKSNRKMLTMEEEIQDLKRRVLELEEEVFPDDGGQGGQGSQGSQSPTPKLSPR